MTRSVITLISLALFISNCSTIDSVSEDKRSTAKLQYGSSDSTLTITNNHLLRIFWEDGSGYQQSTQIVESDKNDNKRIEPVRVRLINTQNDHLIVSNDDYIHSENLSYTQTEKVLIDRSYFGLKIPFSAVTKLEIFSDGNEAGRVSYNYSTGKLIGDVIKGGIGGIGIGLAAYAAKQDDFFEESDGPMPLGYILVPGLLGAVGYPIYSFFKSADKKYSTHELVTESSLIYEMYLSKDSWHFAD